MTRTTVMVVILLFNCTECQSRFASTFSYCCCCFFLFVRVLTMYVCFYSQLWKPIFPNPLCTWRGILLCFSLSPPIMGLCVYTSVCMNRFLKHFVLFFFLFLVFFFIRLLPFFSSFFSSDYCFVLSVFFCLFDLFVHTVSFWLFGFLF